MLKYWYKWRLSQAYLCLIVYASRWFAFACSHGGDVVCVEGETGRLIWTTAINGRAESGLTLTGDLKVVSLCSSRTDNCEFA